MWSRQNTSSSKNLVLLTFKNYFMTKKMKDQSDIDRKNKEIYSLIMELGVTLADLNYQWPNKLRKNFEKVTSNLKETITMATKKQK